MDSSSLSPSSIAGADGVGAAGAPRARWFATLLDTSHDLACILDREGRVVHANRRLLEAWGCDAREAVGRRPAEFGVSPWAAETHSREIASVIRTGVPASGQAPFTGAGGIEGVYEYVWAPIVDEQGQVEAIAGSARDVTGRLQLQAAHDRQARFFDAALSSISEYACTFDRLGRFVFANRPLLKRWNLSLEQLRGRNFFDLGYPVDLATRLQAHVEQVFKTRQVVSAEKEYVGRDGQWGAYEYTFAPILAPDGSVEAVAGVTRAVTAQRRAEAALRESEEHHRSLVELNPQLSWTADPGGGLSSMSDKWLALTGLPVEAALRSGWEGVLHPDDLPGVVVAWREALHSGQPFDVEHRVRDAEGGFRWSRSRAFPRRDAAGRVLRWYGTTEDISERKAGATALACDKAVLELIATDAPLERVLAEIVRSVQAQVDHPAHASVLLMDESGQQLLLGAAPDLPTGFNQHLQGLRVGPDAGCCGTAAFDGVVVCTHDIAEDAIWAGLRAAALAHGIRACCSTPIPSSDGRVLGTVAMYYGEPHTPSSRDLELARSVTRLAAIAIERRQAAERLQRSLAAEQHARAEAERASRMKEEFLATIGHELRTPLSAIVGWSQLLRTRKVDEQRMQDGLDAIARSARAQAQIIEDLLDMSAIVSGKVRLVTQPLDLTRVINDALETVRPAAEAKGIALTAALDPFTGLVSGDAGRLQQVLWNLLTNAVKFTPRGGRVQVMLGRVHSRVEMSVTDTGQGIPTEFQSVIFDRFRQVDAKTTREHGGLGLGLAITRQLVDMHGGSISVRSAGPGHGSTFTVSLPVPAVQLPPAAASMSDAGAPLPVDWAAGPVLEGVKVLVVDDDAETRALLHRLLDDCEASVRTAASVQEALALLHDERPHVLVSDIGMPGEDGYTLIRRVRTLEPAAGGDVPAIALTAYARAEDRIQAVRAGFDMHLAKPVEPAEVVTMVASLARRKNGTVG